jgi:hypothetical protein
MTAVETPEQARRSQRKIEDFAFKAYDAQCAAQALEATLRELADYPGDIGEAVHQLRLAATFIATDAISWARSQQCGLRRPLPELRGCPVSQSNNHDGTCSQCHQDAARFHPAAQVYVEWSTEDTVEGNGCVAEMFCSWICAAKWFAVQAGFEAPAR